MKSRSALLKILLQRRQAATERGNSLIEVIAAIVMFSITVAAIAPPLALSAATRIQNRRIQQANVLAQQEIDRVAALLERPLGIQQDLETGLLPPLSGTSLAATPAPTTLVNTRGAIGSPSDALLFDIDGDNQDDFFIQVIGSSAVRLSVGNIGQVGILQMEVRVYDIAAAENLGALDTTPINSGLVSSLTQASTMPLIVRQSVLSQSDGGLTLQDFQNFICQDPPPNTPAADCP